MEGKRISEKITFSKTREGKYLVFLGIATTGRNGKQTKRREDLGKVSAGEMYMMGTKGNRRHITGNLCS